MNILFLTWKDIKHPHKGGAEQIMLEYARGLVELGHQVTWFASSFAGALPEEDYAGIHIIRRYTNHTIWMRAHSWYKQFRKNNQIDVIIDEAGGWPLLSPLYEKNIPIFFFAHHIGDREFDRNTDFGILSPLIRKLAKWVYLQSFGVYKNNKSIVVSHSTKQELIDRFDFDVEKISVIENTTEILPISQIPYATRTNHILFFGRITAIKRADHAVRAFASVLSELPHDAELHLIGNAQDLPYVESMKKLITELDISDRIHFLGHIDREQFAETLASYKCMLVPSEKEGYGLVVIEGNAYGLPVIAYDVAGLRDSILPGINGILVPEGDYVRMGQEIVNMFANNADYRTICESSLQHVSTIPSWHEQVKKFEKIITQK